MECQILFSGENTSKCHLPKFLPEILSVKVLGVCKGVCKPLKRQEKLHLKMSSVYVVC